MFRPVVALAPLLALSSCGLFCEDPTALTEDMLANAGPNASPTCEEKLPYQITELGLAYISAYGFDSEDVEKVHWDLPEGMRIYHSNDRQSGIGSYTAEASGEYCATIEMKCGKMSNTVCRNLTVLGGSVDVSVGQANEHEAALRNGGIGAVVDGTLYFGLGAEQGGGNSETWWKWSWESLEWTQLSDWPLGYPTKTEKSFVLDGQIHIVNGNAHAIYDPASDTWSETTAQPLGLVDWLYEFDGEVYVEIGQDYVFRYDDLDQSWEELGQVGPPGETLASFSTGGVNYVITDSGGFLEGSFSDGWTGADFSGCSVGEVFGAAAIGGDRAVVVGSGGESTWCLFEPGQGWSMEPRPTPSCGLGASYGASRGATVYGFEDRVAYLGGVSDDNASVYGMGAVLIRD